MKTRYVFFKNCMIIFMRLVFDIVPDDPIVETGRKNN